jgi:hypothetical protein
VNFCTRHLVVSVGISGNHRNPVHREACIPQLVQGLFGITTVGKNANGSFSIS